MQRINASVILDDAYRLIGWDAAKLEARSVADARAAFSLALQEVWEAWWWSEVMETQRVQFAPRWLSTSFAGDQSTVFYSPETDAYYLYLLRASNQPPVDAAGATQTQYYWSKWDERLNPAPWDTARESAAGYAVGDQVSWNAVNYQRGPLTGIEEPGTVAVGFFPIPKWLPIPDWSPVTPWTDGAGVLQGPRGPVRSVSRLDSRTTANVEGYHFEDTGAGTRIYGLRAGRPWITSRRVTPVVTGDPFDALVTYTAADPELRW
jgi:hypothetical protein